MVSQFWSPGAAYGVAILVTGSLLRLNHRSSEWVLSSVAYGDAISVGTRAPTLLVARKFSSENAKSGSGFRAGSVPRLNLTKNVGILNAVFEIIVLFTHNGTS